MTALVLFEFGQEIPACLTPLWYADGHLQLKILEKGQIGIS